MRYILFFAALLVLVTACDNPETLVDKADGTITGSILPGVAGTASGKIYVVASYTNDLQDVDWTRNRDVLGRFGTYEINELPGGKYYLAMYLDQNNNEALDSGEFWGGYEANGDRRLDLVTLDGGKTLMKDITFLGRY